MHWTARLSPRKWNHPAPMSARTYAGVVTTSCTKRLRRPATLHFSTKIGTDAKVAMVREALM
jgi:hypothetical protein